MRTRTVLLAVAAAAVAASPSAAALVETFPETRVVIRTYDPGMLQPADRESALAAAMRIIEAAGLSAEWLSCDGAFVRAQEDRCASPLGANELAVRFVRLPPPPDSGRHVALGYSLVDTQVRLGSLATIYVDRVESLAAACGLDLPTLLGRAVAHEIGHLLIGTNGHAPTGLMRAVWSRNLLQRNRTSDWLFTSSDGRTMRNGLRERTARRLAAHLVRGE